MYEPEIICDICGDTLVFYQLAFNKLWLQCTTCKIIRVAIPDQIKPLLMVGDSDGARGSNAVRNLHKRERYFIDMFREVVNINDILLYGIGWSPLFAELKSENLNVIGCDLNKRLIDFRNEEYNEIVFYHPHELPDYKFDIITACEVFEHFINPLEDVTFLIHHLKNNGILCGCTNFWEYGNKLSDDPYWEGNHVVAWNELPMRRIADKHNLKIKFFESDHESWKGKKFFVFYKTDKINKFLETIPYILPIKKVGDIG